MKKYGFKHLFTDNNYFIQHNRNRTYTLHIFNLRFFHRGKMLMFPDNCGHYVIET